MSRPRRSAYTLLEVILAMSISMVLLAALYKTLKLHLTTSQLGPQVVEREQLTRVIAHQLRQDLGHLVAPKQDSNVEATATEVRFRSQALTQFTGLVGESRWIEFFSEEPLVDADRNQRTPVGITRIRYEFTDGTNEAAIGTWSRTQVPAEFARGFDRGDPEAQRWATTDVVSDQLSVALLEYWDVDSNTWVTSWAAARSLPPQAIRLTFQLPSLTSAAEYSADSRSLQRVVVDLSQQRAVARLSSRTNNPTFEPIRP